MKKKKEKKSANFTDFLNTKNTHLLYPMIGVSIVESKLFREPGKKKKKKKCLFSIKIYVTHKNKTLNLGNRLKMIKSELDSSNLHSKSNI